MTTIGDTYGSAGIPSSCDFVIGALDWLLRGMWPESKTTEAASVRSTRARDRQKYVSRSVMARTSVARRDTMSLGVRRSGSDCRVR